MSSGKDVSSLKSTVASQTTVRRISTMPIALTIAGSDSGGGAGIQADIKTFSALGVYGASVLTATTAQNTLAVTDIHDLPPAHILAQLEAVISDLDVRAIKTGMLGRAVVVSALAESLSHFLAEHPDVPLVIDPVMVAKSGDMLLSSDAVQAMVTQLLPLATLITPNLPEALTLLAAIDPRSATQLEALLRVASDEPALAAALVALAETLARLINASVLLKGGHLNEYASNTAASRVLPVIDVLVCDQSTHVFRAVRLITRNTHGTGCTLSAAIAARLASGDDLKAAVTCARAYLHEAIAAADQLQIGSGHGPVHHFYKRLQSP